MPPISVLVVDDAVVVRRMVSDVLADDADLRVVGMAANGVIALQKLTQLQPDCVILDVEMPAMSGLEVLKALRTSHPRLPVIMFSSFTERGAAATLDALALGASDYVAKPSNTGSVSVARQRIRDELVPKIKGLCRGRAADAAVRPVAVPARAKTPRVASGTGGMLTRTDRAIPPDILVVGVSTGGPNALAVVLPQLPADFPLPIAIVQHMPPMFTRLLAQRLDQQCALHVVEATDGLALTPGTVAIAPGDHHMVVHSRPGRRLLVRLNQDPPENSCRPAVDPLFRSAVDACGGRVLAVVLTGMGQDGLRGCETVRAAGGRVVVQDEASSVVWGMPGLVARGGLAHAVMPLSEMAAELLRRSAWAPRALTV